MSEFTDDMANTTPVPQGTRGVPNRQTGTKDLAVLITFAARKRTKHHSVLRSPVHQELSSLFTGAKGSSLSVDSGAYAASTPKDILKVLSREARAKALFSANYLCSDEKNRASFYAQSNRA